jgi:ferric-dicitrate binding protein FerR (iron transport regulator)
MSAIDGRPIDDDSDDATMRLLRLAGPRAQAPSGRSERVRSAVHAAWRQTTRRRARRRRATVGAVLAAAAVLLVSVALRDGTEAPGHALLGHTVAVVERAQGERPRPLGSPVRIGEWVDTTSASRLALRFDDGTLVRVDTGTRLRAIAPAAIELAAGAVYVDTERERGRFEVHTALATARDIGTQFEVRLHDETLRLRVRSGAVELRDPVRTIDARPGTEIVLTSAGATSRAIQVHGADWQWTTKVSPLLEMDGRSLATFLERVAREQGWTLEYAAPAIQAQANTTILHGSVSGLTAEAAVAVAVATSGLRHRLDDGVLVVLLGDDPPGGRRR